MLPCRSYDLRLARHACAALQAFATKWARDGEARERDSAKTKVVEELLGLAVQLVRG
jgi:hypothetical protein